MSQIPEHGSCLVCGSVNPNSMGLVWQLSPENEVYSDHVFDLKQQGPPGCLHGGASAAVMDEVMGLTLWYSGLRVVTANLSVDYIKPVPLNQLVHIRASLTGKTEKRVLAEGRILLPDGSVAVAARGSYAVAPKFFENVEVPFFGLPD